MIKEALEYLDSRFKTASTVQDLKLNGKKYTDRKLHYIEEPSPTSLQIHTLSGLVSFVQGNLDGLNAERLCLHVVSPDTVTLISAYANEEFDRYKHAYATCYAHGFSFEKRYDPENFVIQLQTNFVETENLLAVMKVAGNITAEKSMTSIDDGISQTVSVKKGSVLQESCTVPNPVTLKPYRTFHEVDQPESPFVFRVHDNGDRLPNLALYEADNGLWRLSAIANIQAYLKQHLPNMKVIA